MIPWRAGPRVFVGVVLLATGLGKMLDIPGFAEVVASYDLLPSAGNAFVAAFLPFFELGVGAALVAHWRVRQAALLAIALHGVLIFAVVSALSRGLEVPNCGCFGVFWARPLTGATLVEDLVMAALSILAWAWARQTARVAEVTSPPGSAAPTQR